MKKRNVMLAGLSALLATGLTACGGGRTDGYTYRSYTSALASNWNPHAWETNADQGVLSYLSEGFVSLQPKDTANGVYQWAYDMATSVEDVTASCANDLVRFHGLSETEAAEYVGAITEDNPGQIVYEVKLRDGLKWEDGTPINADSFIESGKLLLDPAMKNYRANLFISGESAIAGAKGHYYSNAIEYLDNGTEEAIASLADLKLENGLYVNATTGLGVKIAVDAPLAYLSGKTLMDYVKKYGDEAFNMDAWNKFIKGATVDKEGFAPANETNLANFRAFLDASTAWGENADYFVNYIYAEVQFPEKGWETVGLYKVDDSTFRYVLATPLDWSSMMVSLMDTWLVEPTLYNSLKDESGKLTTTTYGTSVETTKSYGPYKLKTVEASKQMVLVQNENWWGYETNSDGKLVSTTLFEVDGARRRQYQATSIVIDVLEDAAAKQKFLAGELSEYSPTSSELKDYTLSDALYQVDETYTMSLFFNTNLDALKTMDASKGNVNSVVLTNAKFRKAMSLAIDRAEYVTATPAYKPAYSLMNDLYYYDVWNDPTSSYRRSEPAMQAICNLYGVEYGAGKAYETLEEAYKSINGRNITEAKALMAEACTELVEAGLFTRGEEIKIRVAFAQGSIQSDEEAQIALINKYLNEAVAGSGFRKVTLEPVGNLPDRYATVPAGEYAIGYGAWGGAAFYPFRNFQVYCDSTLYDLNEAACWTPASEKLKITFEYNGETFEDELTWKEWSGALIGNGKYANASNEIKLRITAFMEEAFLEKYYRIPLCGTTAAFLLGYQVSYYTETYNIMYDFGGFRLLKFNYTDFEWEAFVKENGGQIDYR